MSIFGELFRQIGGAGRAGSKDPQKLRQAIVDSIRTINSCDVLKQPSARERCALNIYNKISSEDRIKWKFDNLADHASINRRMMDLLEDEIGVDTRTAQEIRNRVFKIMGWKLQF